MAVGAYEGKAEGTAAVLAQDIVAEQVAEPATAEQVAVLDRVFVELAKSFRNPYEVNAEYILVRGGTLTYSVDRTSKQAQPSGAPQKYQRRLFLAPFRESEGA